MRNKPDESWDCPGFLPEMQPIDAPVGSARNPKGIPEVFLELSVWGGRGNLCSFTMGRSDRDVWETVVHILGAKLKKPYKLAYCKENKAS